ESNSVKRWYENVSAGSKITADVYLRTLGLFCELNNTEPDEIVKLAKDDPREFKNKFMDFVRSIFFEYTSISVASYNIFMGSFKIFLISYSFAIL
ncbi:MAG: hypothetical protein ACP5J2_08560, partial [Caldisericum sp.]